MNATTDRSVPGLRPPADHPDAVRELVRERYGAIAESGACCGPGGCACGCAGATSTLDALGYDAAQQSAVPDGAELGLGCGNPVPHADPAAGEVVLDLGSGAGVDCFVAARRVGEAGRAIGVDMTPAMLARARANAARSGVANVEFRLGEIEHLPVADASVDAIVSNCVINLSPDKPQVFREAWRVLRSGGRLVVSDLVLERPLAEELRRRADLLVGCVAGALLEADYLALAREAGFERLEVLDRRRYAEGAIDDAGAREAFDAVRSITLRAWKP